MNKTKIDYLDYTWNPIAMRCTPISEGCANCWHLRMADRMKNNPKLPTKVRQAYAGQLLPFVVQSRRHDPIRVKKPSVIGVQFMGDLFHPDIDYADINSVFVRMVEYDWHTYIVLTKRPERMKEFMSIGTGWRGMLKNLWIGVSVENQARADERIPVLLQVPAAKRFVSIEPMLAPVDLHMRDTQADVVWRRTTGASAYGDRRRLNWVIAGCESGPKRRLAQTDWFRSLLDQCQDAGIPFFLKQAEVDGKVFSLPELDGRNTACKVWAEMPT